MSPNANSTYLLNPERSRAGKPTLLRVDLLRGDTAWTSETVVYFENLRCNSLLVFPVVYITCLQVKVFFPDTREVGELQSLCDSVRCWAQDLDACDLMRSGSCTGLHWVMADTTSLVLNMHIAWIGSSSPSCSRAKYNNNQLNAIPWNVLF